MQKHMVNGRRGLWWLVRDPKSLHQFGLSKVVRQRVVRDGPMVPRSGRPASGFRRDDSLSRQRVMVSVKVKTGVPKDAGRWIPEYWPESVGQDIPTANAFGGQDVERCLGEVVRHIAVVTVGPKRGLLVPQAVGTGHLLLLGDDSAIDSLCLPDTNSFSVGVVEEGGRVRFPRAIEVVRLTTTVSARLEALGCIRHAVLAASVLGHVGHVSEYLAWSMPGERKVPGFTNGLLKGWAAVGVIKSWGSTSRMGKGCTKTRLEYHRSIREERSQYSQDL